MNDFKNMSERYRKQMLDLYKRYPKDIPLQVSQNMDTPKLQDVPTPEKDIPLDDATEPTLESSQPIEERYPTPVIPPFIYQSDEDGITELPPIDAQSDQVGYLKVTTRSANETIPLANVSILISKQFDGQEEMLFSLTTNDNGETEIVKLPAPPKKLSESPNADKNLKPYAQYKISAYLNGYYQIVNSTVPIFSGVTSIQRINMIPLPSYTTERKVINIAESEPNL